MEVLLGLVSVGFALSLVVNVVQWLHHRPLPSRKVSSIDQAEEYIEAMRDMALGMLNNVELARFRAGDKEALINKTNELLDEAIQGHRRLRLLLAQHEQSVREHEVQVQMYVKTRPGDAAKSEYRRVKAVKEVDSCQAVLIDHYAKAWRKLSSTPVSIQSAQ